MDQATSWSGTRGLGSFLFYVYDFLTAHFHFMALYMYYISNAFASPFSLYFRSVLLILITLSFLFVLSFSLKNIPSHLNFCKYVSIHFIQFSIFTLNLFLFSFSSFSFILRFFSFLYFLVTIFLFSLLVNKLLLPIVTSIYHRASYFLIDAYGLPLMSSQEFTNHNSTMHMICTMIRDIHACCMFLQVIFSRFCNKKIIFFNI